MATCIASVFASSQSKFNRLSYANVWLNNVESLQKGSLVPRLSRPMAKNSLVTWANIPGAVTLHRVFIT